MAVYRELEASNMPGVALYEPRFGRYQRGTSWFLSTLSGQLEVDCPALQSWDGSMALRDRIARKQGRGPFVVAVLVFPDMEPDPTLQRALADSAVHAVFGVDDLTGQLAGLTKIEQRPTTADIQRKVALIECATPEPETPEMSEMGLHSGQVVIQHVDTVNVYSPSARATARGGPNG